MVGSEGRWGLTGPPSGDSLAVVRADCVPTDGWKAAIGKTVEELEKELQDNPLLRGHFVGAKHDAELGCVMVGIRLSEVRKTA